MLIADATAGDNDKDDEQDSQNALSFRVCRSSDNYSGIPEDDHQVSADDGLNDDSYLGEASSSTNRELQEDIDSPLCSSSDDPHFEDGFADDELVHNDNVTGQQQQPKTVRKGSDRIVVFDDDEANHRQPPDDQGHTPHDHDNDNVDSAVQAKLDSDKWVVTETGHWREGIPKHITTPTSTLAVLLQ